MKNRYRNYLSFGFNCEVGFALQYMGIFKPTLFSWADTRGTDALIFGIENPELLLSDSVTQYAGNMFFCELSSIGFHGKLRFSEAIDINGEVDYDKLEKSLNETRSRLTHLELKQKQAFEDGEVLVIVKYFHDVFEERYLINDSMRLVREAISKKYKTDNFDMLYITESPITCSIEHYRDYCRAINKFSPRSHASEINTEAWKNIMEEFITPLENKLSAPLEKAAKYWSEHRTLSRTRWWLEPTIVRHVNRLICNEDIEGNSAGIQHRLKSISQCKGFRKGISVACGNGAKELQLIKNGLVDKFELYEISSTRVEQGIKLAHQLGIQDKVQFHLADAFNENLDTDFDLVYWDSALHHK